MSGLPLLPGRVAWYALGRFWAAPNDQAESAPSGAEGAFDAGYFALLEPVPTAAMFDGPIGPAHAHFTFHAERFTVTAIQGGSSADQLSIASDDTGEFTLYYQAAPQGDFQRPESFRAGVVIARFRRPVTVIGVQQGDLKLNTFSAELVDAWPFEHRGRRYDLREAVPHGITQWGVGTGASDATHATFVGSAIAIGRP